MRRLLLFLALILLLRRRRHHRVSDAAVGCSGCPSSCLACASPENNPNKPCTDMQCTACANGTPVHRPTERTIDGQTVRVGTCRSVGAGTGCIRCHPDCAKCEHPQSHMGEWVFECGDAFCTQCADPNDELVSVGLTGRTVDGTVVGRCT